MTTRWLVVAGFVVLICVRMPNVLLEGRFLAEEGTAFLRFGWEMPWPAALLHPFGGYLNLIANIGGILASRTVPLEYAPYITTIIGIIFQTFPAILIVTSRVSWLRPRWAIGLALLIIATPPTSQEVWLQTLHCQFHLALCAALILAMETEAPARLRWFRRFLLLLGPLCGPASIALVPFFALRALLSRNLERGLQLLTLSLGAGLQMGLFFSHAPERHEGIGPSMLACVMAVHHILVPFLGAHLSRGLTLSLRDYVLAGHRPWLTAIAGTFFFLAWMVIIFVTRCRAAAWLFVPGLAVAGLSYYGALGDRRDFLLYFFGARYAYVPQVLFGLSLLALAVERRGILARIALGLSIWIACIGSIEYFSSLDIFRQGPNWQHEVAEWRKDPTHALKVWPEGWAVTLPAQRGS